MVRFSVAAFVPEPTPQETGASEDGSLRMAVQLPPPLPHAPLVIAVSDVATEHMSAEVTLKQVVQVAEEIARMAQAAVEAAQAVKAAAEQIARSLPATGAAIRAVVDAATTATLQAEALEDSAAKMPGASIGRPAASTRSNEGPESFMRGVA